MKESIKFAAFLSLSLILLRSLLSSIPPQFLMPSPSDIAPNTLVPFHGFEKSFIHEPYDWEALFSIQS